MKKVFFFALLLSACAAKPSAPLSSGCEWTEFIYWSAGDTKETIEQVEIHNLTRVCVCGVKIEGVECPKL